MSNDVQGQQVLFEGMDKFCGPLHQSDIGMMLRCRRAMLYRYKLGLRPKSDLRAGAAGLGQMFHKIVQYGPGGIEFAKKWVQDQQKILWELVEKGEDVDGSIAGAVKAMTDHYNKAMAIAQLYWERYPDPEYLETLATEVHVEGDVEICGNKVTVAGTIDKVVRDKRDGRLWVRDWKTSSRDMNYIMTGYQWSIQCRMYRLLAWLWAKQNEIENPEPLGFIVDGVRMPTIKYCKKDVDFAAYIERCKQWYKDNLIDAFTSRAIRYQEPMLSDIFMSSLVDAAYTQKDTALELWQYPKDMTASYCTNYDRQCTYYGLCEVDQCQWPDIIERQFKVVEPTDNVNTETGEVNE